MTKSTHTITLIIACALLALAAAPSLTQPARADLPPRPTSTPIPQPAPPPAKGARLELQVQFPETPSYQWQELWTVVQWQDEWGYWHTVEGWQGTIDHVATSENGEIVGKGVWHVAENDLGGGPFRWRIYRNKGSWLLAQSDEFDLPNAKGEIVTIQVSLGP